jgi:hypothetical protein
MTDPTTVEKWVHLYAGACEEVLVAAQACGQTATRAVHFRSQIAEHQHDGLPGTPIAIRSFTNDAERAEAEFAPLYRAFAQACATAADAAAQLIAAAGSIELADQAAFDFIDAEPWPRISTAKAILRSHHGPSPEAFVASIEETNAIIRDDGPKDGVLYVPPPPEQSDERTCPWCAETIKAAAVICRYCGRDVQVQPNVAG